jgi:hypothetical protein
MVDKYWYIPPVIFHQSSYWCFSIFLFPMANFQRYELAKLEPKNDWAVLCW